MSPEPDPYRTLGLAPGATPDEIRRAYRRLAKENHPDSAGDAATPRFLAIQAAYEILTAPRTGRRPGTRPPGPGGPPPREPWRTDPRRARATPGGGTGDPGGSRGTGPGASRRAPGSRPGGAAGSGGGGAGSRSAGSTGGPSEARRGGTRRRAPNRATLGSTSYDAAEDEPLDPEWSGGTWYGASSGTYWTINPKEYADPRKHGPEYQRRARRRGPDGRPLDPPAAPDGPDVRPPSGDWAPSWAGTDADPSPAGDRGAAKGRSQRDAPPAGEGPSAPGGTRPGGGSSEPGDRPGPRNVDAGTAEAFGDAGAAGRTGSAGAAGPEPAIRVRTTAAKSGAPRPPLIDPDALDGAAARPTGRLWLALAGWPPLGVALATVVGESSGCSRFAASCVELFGIGTWIAQLALIVLLLALPRLAAISAVGTLFVLAVAAPAAVVLSATGGARQPDASAAVLGVVLAIAYLAGVAVAVVRRLRPGRPPGLP